MYKVDKLYINERIKEIVLGSKLFQIPIGIMALFVGISLFQYKKTKILSIRSICWVGRVININLLEKISIFIIKKWYLNLFIKNETLLFNTYKISKEFNRSVEIYSLDGIAKISLFRDMIILKEPSVNEKGVILIKYTPEFDAFHYYFDFDKIRRDYYLVLEPSWAGTCDPSILMFWRNSICKDVVVQAIEPKDYNFIKKMGGNLAPIDIGSGDWVDQNIFSFDIGVKKEFDLIMVSNWAIHKKHVALFKALSQIGIKLSVVLIGFESGGRTKKNIIQEIAHYNLNHIEFNVIENISAKMVSEYLKKSKVYLLLSKKEGPNKAIIESFFVNVPAIVYDKFIGGAQMRINNKTGILSSYKELPNNIMYMVKNFNKFTPRDWILKNSGSTMSTKKLNNVLMGLALQNNENWEKSIFEKVNSPNLKYKNEVKLKNNLKDIYMKYKKVI